MSHILAAPKPLSRETVANVSHSGRHGAGEALQDAGLAHRCDVLCNSEAPEEPVLRQFCDTFPTLGARERG